MTVMVAIGVNGDGYREVIGCAEGFTESKECWRDFLSWLKSRGLRGVRMFTGDKAAGMVGSIAEVFPKAKYQRCTAHFYRNALAKVPKSKRSQVAAMLKAIHAMESREASAAKAESVAAELESMKLKEAAKVVREGFASSLGRGFRYVSAFSNLTFELWMVLHKGDCPALAHRKQYLKPINDLNGEHFESLDEYKNEANSKRVLGKLTVDDAVTAIGRAETLAKRAEEHGLRRTQHCGYSYYLDNSATDLWVPVKQMLEESGGDRLSAGTLSIENKYEGWNGESPQLPYFFGRKIALRRAPGAQNEGEAAAQGRLPSSSASSSLCQHLVHALLHGRVARVQAAISFVAVAVVVPQITARAKASTSPPPFDPPRPSISLTQA